MLNLRRVDLNLLTVFEAIFAERNLTRAANRIGMSQPAMSNALNRLRHLFSDELFVRQGNTMQPTPRAQQIARQVDTALNAVRECVGEVSQFDPRIGRTFNIAGIESIDHFILPNLLAEIGEYVDSIQINTYAGFGDDFVDQLKTGDIDVLIDAEPLRNEEFEVQHLATDKLVCMVREGHPAANRKLSQKDFDELYHVVLHAHDSHGFHMERDLLDRGHSDRIAVRAAHLFALPLIAATTDLVCSVPEIVAQFFVEKHKLVILDVPIAMAVFPVVMIWHHSQNSDPGHRWIRRKILDACRDL